MERKVVFITGANGGIGIELCKKFGSSGFDLIVHTRRLDRNFLHLIDELSKDFSITYRNVIFDLSDPKQVKQELIKFLKSKPRIDVLLNNAGMEHGGFVLSTSLEKMEEVFKINFFSPYLISQLLFRTLCRYRGSVVNIGSILGLDLPEGTVAYGLSKQALMGLARVLAKEGGRYGLRVNAVAPGVVDTRMGKKMENKLRTQLLERTSLKKEATVVDIANLVFFLASDEAEHITGQIIRIDGGLM